MADPTAAEVVPKVIIKEAIPATPTAGSAEAMAKTIADKVTAGNWRAGLEELTKAKKEEPIKPSIIGEKAEEIGITYDAVTGTKVRTPEEQRRYNQFNEDAKKAKALLEKGFDALTPAERNTLVAGVLKGARLNPAFSAQLDAMSPAQQRQFAERILHDPRYLLKVRERFVSFLDPKNKLSDDAQEAQDKYEAAKLDADEKDQEVVEVNRRYNAVTDKLRDYERPIGGTPGSKASDIDRLRATMPALLAGLPNLQRDARDAQNDVDTLKEELRLSQGRGWTGRPAADIQAELTTAKRNLTNADDRKIAAEAEVRKLKDLEQEQAQLEEEKRNLDKERLTRNSEHQKVKLELQKRLRIAQDAKSVRASQEDDLVDGMADIYAGSASELFDEQTTAAIAELDAQLEEQKKKGDSDKADATSRELSRLYDRLQQRWVGAERVRRRGVYGFRREERYRPINREIVNQDMAALLEVGPDPLMVRMVQDQRNDATGRPYTLAEARALLANKEFADKLRQDAVKQVVSRKILIGGLRPEEIHIITSADWGKGMIDSALQQNKEFRAAVAGVMGENALNNSPAFWSRFGEEATRNGWWLLLLGVPVIGAGVIAARAMREGQNVLR